MPEKGAHRAIAGWVSKERRRRGLAPRRLCDEVVDAKGIDAIQEKANRENSIPIHPSALLYLSLSTNNPYPPTPTRTVTRSPVSERSSRFSTESPRICRTRPRRQFIRSQPGLRADTEIPPCVCMCVCGGRFHRFFLHGLYLFRKGDLTVA